VENMFFVDALMRLFVDAFGVDAFGVEFKVQSSKFQVQGSKPSAIAISHRHYVGRLR